MKKSDTLRAEAEKLYQELQDAGVEVLFDDRESRPGVMFADMELLGLPMRVVISDKGLDKGMVEYKGRTDEQSTDVSRSEIVQFVAKQIQQ